MILSQKVVEGQTITPVSPSTSQLSQTPPNLPQTITVKRFEFEGNTAFTVAELAKVTAPFTNRPLSFTELLQAETAVTQLYTEAGYINSGAVIPANQTLSQQEAIVKIQIIEGSVEEIRVTVDGRLHPDYIRSRLALATTKPLNRDRLLEALQVLQLNPIIESISAELSTGSRPQLSILTVRVVEADTFELELFTDNNREPSVGSVRSGIRLYQDDLLGWGDSLYGEYYNTDGSNTLNLRYSLPFNPRNGTISLIGGWTDSQVVEQPFNRLDLTGNSYYAELSVRQPVLETPRQEMALGISMSYQDTENFISGFPLPSRFTDAQGKTRISALRLFQEWTRRNSRDVLAVRSQFNVGIDAIDATIQAVFPDSRFFSWRGQGQYVRLLAPDTLLVLRSDLQLTPDPLLPAEQFGLGGLYSVRGYRQEIVRTDNGFFASAEVRIPIVRVDGVDGLLQLAPFVDVGVGWNSDDFPEPEPNNLGSVGLGLQWEMGRDFSARLDWGIPLTEFELEERTLQEQGIYFRVNYRFF